MITANLLPALINNQHSVTFTLGIEGLQSLLNLEAACCMAVRCLTASSSIYTHKAMIQHSHPQGTSFSLTDFPKTDTPAMPAEVLDAYEQGEAPGGPRLPACIVTERGDYTLHAWLSSRTK